MWTDGLADNQIDRNDEPNSRFWKLCRSTYKP